MTFTSLKYLIFLILAFAGFWAVPEKYKVPFLLLANLVFYAFASVWYLLLLVYVSLLAYFAGQRLHAKESPTAEEKKRRKGLLTLSLLLFLLPLIIFKYTGFISENIFALVRMFKRDASFDVFRLLLPLGISFYTFAAMGYVIDVYKGKIEPLSDFPLLAASITFFPCIASGPIQRIGDLSSQLKKGRKFDYDLATKGLRLILFGLFKKMVVSDTIALYTDSVFSHIRVYSGFSLLLAAVLFTIQIYVDFSGYSDIAIGSANLLGITLPDNFKNPYFATSFKDFWSRWHISLSTWFRDYVYIPLGGNRVKPARRAENLIATFLLSGLWHGANWTFLFWGGVHGLLQVVEKWFAKPQPKKVPEEAGMHKPRFTVLTLVKILLMFVLITITWVFFKANTIQDAFYALTHAFAGITHPGAYIGAGLADLGMGKDKYFIAMFVMVLLVHDIIDEVKGFDTFICKLPAWLRWVIYIGFTMFLLFMLPAKASNQFIYFQF